MPTLIECLRCEQEYRREVEYLKLKAEKQELDYRAERLRLQAEHIATLKDILRMLGRTV